jgi:arylsulfatase A-like enzyme
MHMDDAVGRILAALDKAGVRDNTLVIFSSDNGGSTVENNDTKYPADDYPSGKLTGNNLPLRGEKGTAYEGGTRVPTIANWPAKLKPGKVASPVHIADWMPTLTKLAGYVASEDLKWDGIDIWPQIAEGAKAPERTLYGVAPGRRASILRRGDWKLIVNRDRTLGDELFDLASDPYEKQNLAEREPQRVVELKELLSQVAARDGDAAVPKNAAKE